MQSSLDADLLQGFRDEVEGYLPAIHAAVADPSRRAEAGRLAHGIKGAASMVGLTQLAAEAAELERCLEESPDSNADVEAAVSCLDAAVRSAFRSAPAIASEQSSDPPAPSLGFDAAEAWTSDYETVPADLVSTFQQEAEELLASIGDALGKLRAQPDDRSLAEPLRRHVHTLKGAAGMVGLRNASKLSHRLEDCLDRLHSGGAESLEQACELLQAGADVLEELCVPGERSAALRQRTLELHQAVAALGSAPLDRLARAVSGEQAPVVSAAQKAESEAGAQGFRTPVEGVDEMLRLSSELNGSHAALDSYRDAWSGEVGQMGAVARTLQQLAERLTSRQLQGRSPAATHKNGASAGFDELELDSYTELALISRDLTELAAEVAGAGARLRSVGSELNQGLRRFGRLNAELQDRLMQLRMAPLSSLRRRLERTVRVTASARSKHVELAMEGDVELDKSVLDAIVGPLEHLLRNAVDHGIESGERRRGLGKPARGRIRLRAWLEGFQAAVELADDGGGFDLDRLRSKAIDAGLLAADRASDATAEHLHRLAFHPGLSTAKAVSEISGRGVGLDAVRSAIAALNGSITVRSEPGAGATFSLRLPTTLAAARLLQVQAAGQTFGIPLYSVTRVLRANLRDVEMSGEGLTLRNPAGKLPLVYLNESLGLESSPLKETFPALIVEAGEQRYVLAVEGWTESRDAVIKSLGPLLSNVRGVSGATMLGDGGVCLVLNPAQLYAEAEAPPEQSGAHKSAEPFQAMVVDDSRSVRTVACNVIQSYGWKTAAARDGLEALEALEIAERLPDVLLLDVEMPRMDGYELTAALRASARLRHLPIVMLTSRAGEKHRQRAFELGADQYLVKPFEPAGLMAALAKAVAQRSEASDG